MVHKIFNNLMITLGLVGVFSLAVIPATVNAAPKDEVCRGIGIASGGGSTCDDPNGGPTVDSAIATVVNILSLLVGVVAIIMIIIGGFKYIISSGDANNITSAKNTILYAIIGLVIVVLAQVIVRFVVNKVA